MSKDLVINAINKYWRAANYLTVAFMYLKDNIFLKRELLESDLKDHPSGHWGTSPGINFIVAHLNRFICYTKRQVQLVIGPGHAGNALFVNLLLEGTLQEYYPIQTEENICFDIDKIQECMAGIRTESNPFFPGTIYDGGELGYSLPVAFGSVLDNPYLLTVCIIGDGEFETGTISSSWRCNKYLNRSSGTVLPIVHLNEYRMGDRSLLSQYSDEEITMFFKSMGYEAKFVCLDHYEMIEALNWVDRMYKQIQKGEQIIWPVLILKNQKGCTAPDEGRMQIKGTLDAHKNPLRKLSKQETVDYVQYWLESYHPEELFDKKGFLKEDITGIIPEKDWRLGRSLAHYVHRKLNLPSIKDFALSPIDKTMTFSNISILVRYLSYVIQQNLHHFMIVSPDELKSNLLGKLKENSNPPKINETGNRILEILNENICQGWMQGYVLTGRNCLMVSYEAFMPIITSMINQFSKWLYQSQKTVWRQNISSMIYILTSLWESNTYSHQNPEFINNLLGSQHKFVRIHMPVDANTLISCLHHCLLSENQIHTIVVSKQAMPQMLDIETASSCVDKGFVQWNYLNTSQKGIDLILAAAGDYPTRECREGIKIIQQYLPDINLRMVSILELTHFGDNMIYPHAMCEEEFNHLFPKETPMVFCFHGYPSAIKILLFERMSCRKISLMGYDNKSTISTNDLNKMVLNGMSRYHIVLQACRFFQEKLPQTLLIEMEEDMQNIIKNFTKGFEMHD